MKKTTMLIVIAIAYFTFAICYKSTGVYDMADLHNLEKPEKENFKLFHYVHEKEYNLNSEEALYRYRIFKENLKWIKAENKRLGKRVYGITRFLDLTHEEFKEKHLIKTEMFEAHKESFLKEMLDKNPRFLQEEKSEEVHYHHHVHHHYDADTKSEDKQNSETKDVDWREWDSPVKNQGACGSCWAFAAIAPIENMYNRLKGKITRFSEQNLVDCLRHGCSGGWSDEAYKWFSTRGGLLPEEHFPYKGKEGVCDQGTYIRYGYTILKGYRRYYKGYPSYSNGTWDELMAQGPMAVYVDASFKGFAWYDPHIRDFAPIDPTGCGISSHAVAAVAVVTENGKKYIIAKNSWGTRWGWKGYFKMPYDNACEMRKYAYQPIVYDGYVPKEHPPKPKPPKSDCVELFKCKDFACEPDKKCDSVYSFSPVWEPYLGVRFPEHRETNKVLDIRTFEKRYCGGWMTKIRESTPVPRINGELAWFKSMAYLKPADTNCINFYNEPCLSGQTAFTLCNDIKDSQDVNLKLEDVWSFAVDNNNISRITFYDAPNFTGESYSYITKGDNEALYRTDLDETLYNMILDKRVRSIKLHKN